MGDTDVSTLPVLIVGAGPIGLTASILLSRLGVAHEIVERRDALHQSPQAHVISARTLEVFRAAGVDPEALAAVSTPAQDTGCVRYVYSLAGPELGVLPIVDAERAASVLDATPCVPTNIPQHRLEPVLLDAAEKAGGHVRFGHAWEGREADAEGVTSILRTPEGGTRRVRSRYLLGCDGAGSRVRRALGIELVGPTELQRFAMVDVAVNLRPVVGERTALLYWSLDPAEPGVMIAHDLGERVVFMLMQPPGQPTPTPDQVRERIAARIGTETRFEVLRVDEWVMTAQVAERYQEGRALLIGDSAHRFPPTGGLGMNTGVADAFNAAWKLAAVLEGRAEPWLLDTYGAERRAVAQANTDQSVANFQQTGRILGALALRPEDDLDAQRAWVRSLPDDPERQARLQQAIDDDARHYDLLDLDLGARYGSEAVVPDGTPEPEWAAGTYVATSRPGARLPHAWLERDGQRVSTLDLVPLDRPLLLLGREGDAWTRAAEALGVTTAMVDGERLADADGRWRELREVGEDGALLVRPDHHVAFRAASLPGDPAASLRHALTSGLGRPLEATS